MKIKIVNATQAHVNAISGKLRQVDEYEIQATSGHSAELALQIGLERSSFCWAAIDGRKVIAIFGVVPMTVLGTCGVPWMLATDELPLYKKAVVKQSKIYIAKMLEHFTILSNWADIRNKTTIRWLKWCGFVFEDEPQVYGVERRLFIRFFNNRE